VALRRGGSRLALLSRPENPAPRQPHRATEATSDKPHLTFIRRTCRTRAPARGEERWDSSRIVSRRRRRGPESGRVAAGSDRSGSGGLGLRLRGGRGQELRLPGERDPAAAAVLACTSARPATVSWRPTRA
jgi:hypothetical protein